MANISKCRKGRELGSRGHVESIVGGTQSPRLSRPGETWAGCGLRRSREDASPHPEDSAHVHSVRDAICAQETKLVDRGGWREWEETQLCVEQ